MFNNIGENKAFQLLTGIVGIYGCYWVAGYLIEKMYLLYYSDSNNPIKSKMKSNMYYSIIPSP